MMPARGDASVAVAQRPGWRTLLLALAAAAALYGCAGTAGTAASSDPAASPPPRASGVTVFGDIDAGVTRERKR